MRAIIEFLTRPAVCLWGTLSSLTFYLLSVGPAAWLLWNLRLPNWIAAALVFLYWPLELAVKRSESFQSLFAAYLHLWVDPTRLVTGNPATSQPDFALPKPPALFVESLATLIGVWLIWNFVRWVNQRHRTAANVSWLIF